MKLLAILSIVTAVTAIWLVQPLRTADYTDGRLNGRYSDVSRRVQIPGQPYLGSGGLSRSMTTNVIASLVSPGLDSAEKAFEKVYLNGRWIDVDRYVVDEASISAAKSRIQAYIEVRDTGEKQEEGARKALQHGTGRPQDVAL